MKKNIDIKFINEYTLLPTLSPNWEKKKKQRLTGKGGGR
jgi:hypothetical protein